MRVIVAGNNILARNVLEWLVNQEEEVVYVVPEGRDIVDEETDWEKPFQPFAKNLCIERRISFGVGNINDLAGEVRMKEPDLIVFCRYVGLIRKDILNSPKRGCLNHHYGKLPKFGGYGTINWALLMGESEIGVTLHYMSERFDDGQIVDQKTVRVNTNKMRVLKFPKELDRPDLEIKGLTSFDVYQIANKLAFQMFQNNYPIIKAGREILRDQDPEDLLYFPKPLLDYDRARCLDLDGVPDIIIARHVRAFTFPPKQLPIGRYSTQSRDGKDIRVQFEMKLQELG